MKQPDCVIIGAGTVGCVLALLLHQQGLSVMLLEQAAQTLTPAAAPQPRTTALNSESLRCLDSVSIWYALKPQATSIERVHIEKPPRAQLTFHAAADSDYPMGVIVDNTLLRYVTHSAVAAAQLLYAETHITDVAQDEAGITLQTNNGMKVRTPLLIAADGRQSQLAARFNRAPQRHDYAQTAITAVIAHEQPHANTAFELFTAAGTVALLPLRGNTSALVWNAENSHAPALMAMPDTWFCESVARATRHTLGAITMLTQREAVPLVQLLLPQIIAPRFAAAGDAAHRIHPLAGQGLNLGLRDALALGAILSDTARLGGDLGDAAVLQRYSARRALDIRSMAGATFCLNALFSNENRLIQKALGLGLHAFNNWPQGAAFFTRHAVGQSALARLSTNGINRAKA